MAKSTFIARGLVAGVHTCHVLKRRPGAALIFPITTLNAEALRAGSVAGEVSSADRAALGVPYRSRWVIEAIQWVPDHWVSGATVELSKASCLQMQALAAAAGKVAPSFKDEDLCRYPAANKTHGKQRIAA